MPVRALARVRPQAITANAALLVSHLGNRATLCAVVKADGYGHGAARAATAALAGGASWLATATATEAADLRTHGIVAPILVMGATTREEAEIAIDADADLAIWDRRFLDTVGHRGPRLHVKYDTGMGRLGTADLDEARALVQAIDLHEHAVLSGVMTHFATADEPGDDHFPRQLERFTAFAREVKEVHPGVIAHAANSAGTLRDPAAHFDMVRAGVALYGLDPLQGDPEASGLQPALSLESYVAAVKSFEPGETAGYGRRWTAREPTKLATIPIGYGDGWRRGLTNNAEVLIRGARHPLVGTVSMDNITVELGPDTDVEVGDRVTLIGTDGDERITAEEVAGRLGTINYEITCGIGPRVPRVEEPA